jgi:Integrase core domain
LRILTDRGTEYCGRVEEHTFQLFLAVEDIDHSKTKARSPQTNGICERFHRTMKEEFYDITFRKKLYHSLEALQQDADNWLKKYNGLRPHSGKHCYGKTPLQTFNETKPLALEKKLDQSFEPEENIQELGELNNASTDALLQRASIAPSTGLIEEPMLQGAKRTKLEMSSYLNDGQSVQ